MAEAYARFLYEKWTRKKPRKNFESNIREIKKENIQPDVSSILEDIYGGKQRHDFHHLNKTVPTEYEQLRSIATEKINALNKAESQIFKYDIIDGGLRTEYELYWEKKDGRYDTFLRLDP